MLGAGAALAVLVVLLIWVSYRRWVQSQQQKREVFADDVTRRGLNARQSQVLLAIVARSGVRRTRDIFTREDAFEQGAARLLAECARTRTSQENEQVKVQIADLREKLGFQVASPSSEDAGPGVPNGWDMPTGRVLMVFGPAGATSSAKGQDRAQILRRTVAAVGQIKRLRRTGGGVSITVELTDLSDAEIDDLTHTAGQRPSRKGGRRRERVPASPGQSPAAPGRSPEAHEAAARTMAAT